MKLWPLLEGSTANSAFLRFCFIAFTKAIPCFQVGLPRVVSSNSIRRMAPRPALRTSMFWPAVRKAEACSANTTCAHAWASQKAALGPAIPAPLMRTRSLKIVCDVLVYGSCEMVSLCPVAKGLSNPEYEARTLRLLPASLRV